jgi:uncharacterized C2H2 Zn-finger protein
MESLMELEKMSESVVEELLAENARLRDQLSKDNSYKFYLLSETPLKISGVLISEGVWKGVLYSYDELTKCIDQFKGLKGLVMHGKTEEFKDRTIGHLTKVGKDDILKAITFEAEVEDPEAIQKIKDKVFDAVSIKGQFKELDTSKIPPVGINYTPIEWSLTGSPACDTCMIFNVEELSKERKDLNKDKKDLPLGDKMSQLNNEEIEIAEDSVLVLPENFDSLEDCSEFEFKVVTFPEFIELAKKKEGYYGYYTAPGKKSKKALKGMKLAGKGKPKYPYYGYYKYGYPYKKKKLEEDYSGILAEVLEGSYKEFMSKCLKEKGGGVDAVKACAKEWKSQQSLEDDFEENELAAIKCPVCNEEFKNLEEFKKHWTKEHQDKYGKYKHAKKLARDIITKSELRSSFKKTLALSEEANTPAPTPVPVPTQASAVVPQPENKPVEVKLTRKEILQKLKKDPHTAAELILESTKE